MFTDDTGSFGVASAAPSRRRARDDVPMSERRFRPGRSRARLHSGRTEPFIEDGVLLPAILLSILLTSTVSLTMQGSASRLLTLALHYPLFLVIALVAAQAAPPRWRSVSCLITAPLVLLELVLAYGRAMIP